MSWNAAGEEHTFCIMFVKVELLSVEAFMKNPLVCSYLLFFIF